MTKSRYTTQTRCDINKEPLYVCILAGGVNYREKSKPPRILQIHNAESILQHQVRAIAHAHPNSFVSVTAGFQAEKVIKGSPGIPVVENCSFLTTNTMEEVRLYLNTVFPHRLLLIDGAIYFNPIALHFIENANVLGCESNDPKEVGFHSTEGLVDHFGYAYSTKWGGLVYLEGKAIESLKKHSKRENNKLSLFEGLNLLIDDNIPLKSTTNSKAEIVKL